ncbi:hypothetical protein [Hazenella coriacea]|uniref:Uncharacterized protein n=1 Tax=Hazenella coriacea TaxID=1179467 RepID=A0A4R3LC48_9BACL|nr:hypothetical protein [Hazenella coriacea]TCS96878.1 hypothetical protein EDD58_101523 [Hazenella coriacea]
MKKVLLSLAAIIIIIFICLAIGLTILFNEIEDFTNSFDTSDEALIAYAKKEHNIPIRVIENPGVPGGELIYKDAKVVTEDGEEIHFDIYISGIGPFLGRITGDNYKEAKQKLDLNRKYKGSAIFHELENLGYKNLTFGKSKKDFDFKAEIEGMSFADQQMFNHIFRSLPSFYKLKKELHKSNYSIDEIYIVTNSGTFAINGANLDLNQTYSSPEHLRNQFAQQNIDVFSSFLFEKDFSQIQSILPILQANGFNDGNKNRFRLKCYEMTTYERCDAYSFEIHTGDQKPVRTPLRYDDPVAKAKLLKAIQSLQKVDLPIKKLEVNLVYVPEKMEKQSIPEKELKEQEHLHFFSTTVKIKDFRQIKTVDDIYFDYLSR